MAALDCPSLSATTAGSIPDCSSVEAWKCRRPWSVISGQPALLVILSTTRAMTVGRCHASTPCRRKTTGSAPSPVRSQFRFAWRGDFGSSTIVSLSMSMLPLCSYEADALAAHRPQVLVADAPQADSTCSIAANPSASRSLSSPIYVWTPLCTRQRRLVSRVRVAGQH